MSLWAWETVGRVTRVKPAAAAETTSQFCTTLLDGGAAPEARTRRTRVSTRFFPNLAHFLPRLHKPAVTSEVVLALEP
jgi:hypothetical protein